MSDRDEAAGARATPSAAVTAENKRSLAVSTAASESPAGAERKEAASATAASGDVSKSKAATAAAATAGPAYSSEDRILYDVFVHPPEWMPDDTPEERVSNSLYYPVSEAEYAAQQTARAALRHTALAALQRGLRYKPKKWCKRIGCCFRCGCCPDQCRHDPSDDATNGSVVVSSSDSKEQIDAAIRRKAAAEDDDADDTAEDDSASGGGGGGGGARGRDGTERERNWDVAVSPNADLVAIVRERSICIRWIGTEFATRELEWSIPPYPRFVHPTSNDATATAPASASPAAGAPPNQSPAPQLLGYQSLTRHHMRPFAWSARGELIAVAHSQSSVSVYDVRNGGALVHTLSIASTPTPPKQPHDTTQSTSGDGTSAVSAVSAAAPVIVGVVSAIPTSLALPALPPLLGRRVEPAIAAIVFREAACDETMIGGTCPHLMILTYDGTIHHLHVPPFPPPLVLPLPATTATEPQSAASDAPPSPAAANSTLPFALVPSAAGTIPPAFPPHAPPSSTGSGSLSAAAIQTPPPAALRRRPQSASSTSRLFQDLKSGDEKRDDSDERGSGSVRTFSLPAAERDITSPLSGKRHYVSMCYDPVASAIAVVSVFAIDRRPKVTLWRVRDSVSPFFALSMHTADPKPDPTLTPSKKPSRLWSLVGKLLGQTDGPGTAATRAALPTAGTNSNATASTSTGLVGYESKAVFSPDGSRLALLTRIGGSVFVWDVRSHSQQIKLLEHITRNSPFPSESPFQSAAVPSPVSATADGAAPATDSAPTSSALLHAVAVASNPGVNEICDVSWWSNSVLARVYRSGHLALCPIRSNLNLLLGNELFAGGVPKLAAAAPPPPPPLSQPPQPFAGSSLSTHREEHSPLGGLKLTAPAAPPPPQRLFVLECERKFQRRRKLWTQLTARQHEQHTVIHLRRTYRLLSLCRAIPHEFYLRKIGDHQFEEALELAQTYVLNTDPVYQMQWSTSPVSESTINQYLKRVSDRAWILDECLRRQCDDDLSTRALLQYGLSLTLPLTSRSAAAAAAAAADEKTDLMSSLSPLPHAFGTASSETALFPLPLDVESGRSCVYRFLLLRYLDRLQTFMAIHTVFDAAAFFQFRSCNLVEAACKYARAGNIRAVEMLLSYHREEVWLSRRQILFELPETVPPNLYFHLLPVPAARDSAPKRWRATDWVESDAVLRSILSLYDRKVITASPLSAQLLRAVLRERKLLASRVADSGSAVLSGSVYEYSDDELTQFYIHRMRQIDRVSGQLEQVMSLCQFARQNKITGLDSFERTLRDVDILVYEYSLDITLSEYEPRNEFARLCLVLADSTVESIVADLKGKATVLISTEREAERQKLQFSIAGGHATDSDPASGAFASALPDSLLQLLTPPTLLHRWMVHIAATRLDLVKEILWWSRPKVLQSHERIIPNTHELLRIALDCLYACPASDVQHANWMTDIFSCLPVRGVPGAADDVIYNMLQDRVDAFEQHLTAAELLTKYGVPRPVRFFLHLSAPPANDTKRQPASEQKYGTGADAKSDTAITDPFRFGSATPASALTPIQRESFDILQSLSRKAVRRKPALTVSEWEKMLSDILELRHQVFTLIPKTVCYAHFIQNVCSAGHFALARAILSALVTGGDYDVSHVPASLMASLPASAAKQHAPSHPLPAADQKSGATKRPAPRTPPLFTVEMAERVVLSSAVELFNSAPSVEHASMRMAKDCLAMLPLPTANANATANTGSAPSTSSAGAGSGGSRASLSAFVGSLTTLAGSASAAAASAAGGNRSLPVSAEVQSELDLIEAVTRLVSFGVVVVPLEVRLSSNRLEFIQSLLKARPNTYKDEVTVLSLCRLLGCRTGEDTARAKMLIVERAIDAADPKTAHKTCLSLMESDRYRPASALCVRVAELITSDDDSSGGAGAVSASRTAAKLQMISHALWSCDTRSEQFEQLLSQWKRLAAGRVDSIHSIPQILSRRVGDTAAEFDLKSDVSGSAFPLVHDSELAAEDSASGRAPEMERLIASCFSSGGDAGPALLDISDDAVRHDAYTQRAHHPTLSTATVLGTNLLSLRQHFAPSLQARADAKSDSDSLTITNGGSLRTGTGSGSFNPARGAEIDRTLLALAEESCVSDPALALSYLLSLSTPLNAKLRFDVLIAAPPPAAAAPISPVTAPSAPAPAAADTKSSIDEPAGVTEDGGSDEPDSELAIAALLKNIAPAIAVTPQAPASTADAAPAALPAESASPSSASTQAASARLSRARRQALIEVAFRFFSTLTLLRAKAAEGRALLDSTLDELQSLLSALPIAAASAADSKSDSALLHDETAQLAAAAREYGEVWSECARAGLVVTLIPHIDLMRFITDKAYQHESVLELTHAAPFAAAAPATAGDVKSQPATAASASAAAATSVITMDSAVLLCRRYSIPVFDVYAERFVWLFGAAPSVQAIRDELGAASPAAAELFTTQNAARMEAVLCRAYAVTDGLDLTRLTFLFTLADECAHRIADNNRTARPASGPAAAAAAALRSSVASAHLQMLQNFVKAGIAVDYKQLIDPVTCISHLQYVVLEENMFVLSRFATRIADLVFAPPPPGTVFPPPPPPHSFASAAAASPLTPSTVFVLFLRNSLRSVSCSSASGAVSDWFTNAANRKVFDRISNAEFVSVVLDQVLSPLPANASPATVTDLARSTDIWVRLDIIERANDVVDSRLAAAAAKIVSGSTPEAKAQAALTRAENVRLWHDCIRAFEWLSALCSLQDLVWLKSSSFWPSLDRTRGEAGAVRRGLLDILDHSTELQLSKSRLESVLSVLNDERANHTEQYRKYDDAADSKSASIAAATAAVDWTVDSLLAESVNRNVARCSGGGNSDATPFRALHGLLCAFSATASAALNSALLKPIIAAASIEPEQPFTSAGSAEDAINRRLNQIGVLQVLSDLQSQLSVRVPLPHAASVPLLFFRNVNPACTIRSPFVECDSINPYLCPRRQAATAAAVTASDAKSDIKTAAAAAAGKVAVKSGSVTASPFHASLSAELRASAPARRQQLELLFSHVILLAFKAVTPSAAAAAAADTKSAAASVELPVLSALPASAVLASATERLQLITALVTASAERNSHLLLTAAASLVTAWIDAASTAADEKGAVSVVSDDLKRASVLVIDRIFVLASADPAAAVQLLRLTFNKSVIPGLTKAFQETVYGRAKTAFADSGVSSLAVLPFELGFLCSSSAVRLTAAEEFVSYLSRLPDGNSPRSVLHANPQIVPLILHASLLHRFASEPAVFALITQYILSRHSGGAGSGAGAASAVVPDSAEADDPFVASLPHSLALLTTHRLYAQAITLLYTSRNMHSSGGAAVTDEFGFRTLKQYFSERPSVGSGSVLAAGFFSSAKQTLESDGH